MLFVVARVPKVGGMAVTQGATPQAIVWARLSHRSGLAQMWFVAFFLCTSLTGDQVMSLPDSKEHLPCRTST